MSGRTTQTSVDGLVVLDKPPGCTSHDVVARLRRTFGQHRVGHAGTLDPDATGVLLVGLGRVTRLLRFLTPLGKSYECELVLGVETSTLDASGVTVATHDMSGVGLEDVRSVAATFVGSITQVPPMVSAVKVGGRRLHELARQGLEVERPSRVVSISGIEIDSTNDQGIFAMRVHCSSGTYVRTLAADIGGALGGGAHLRNLRRTAVGGFTLQEACSLETPVVLSPREALRDYPAVEVAGKAATLVGHGRPLPRWSGEGPWAVVDAQGELLAVYEAFDRETARAAVVIAPATGR